MPPKRRADKLKSASAATKPDPPKPTTSVKSAPSPPPPPPPLASAPPALPLFPETDATKVRREWSKFIDAWYEPQKKKLVEKLQRDLLVKYKNLGSAKETQKLREMELYEKLDDIARQLTQPARAEWERRLERAQLREDQWDDMSGEEQHDVMSVFVGFFMDDVDLSVEPSSIEEEEYIAEDPLHRVIPSFPPAASSRQIIPPTPTRQTFEFVNPTSFFADAMTPPNPSKNLPALSMDHLATLGPSNTARSAEPVSAGVNGMFSFQNWASEAGIVTQQPLPQSAKPPLASTSAPPQTLSARPRATDMSSRQTSAASSLSSPPMKAASPQYSPPNPTTKFSPPINTETHPLGKRYIGPVILEEDPDPLEEDLLKSKMANEYQQYKISLRMQMIYQFHAEAAQVEIKLFETLLADDGTKESRAKAVQEHETSMMRLREQKEEERKRLCAEEREKRRGEMRQHLAQRRSPHNREIDKANPPPPKPLPEKTTSALPRPGKATHQKENVPLPQAVAASSSKLEPPGVIKKSNSMLSQDETSANEALFANAMAMMQAKPGGSVLTPAQASLNEALFSNAAAMLAPQGPSGSSNKNLVPLPSIMKKSNSSRSQEHDVPQITVSFAEPHSAAPAPVPEPAQAPSAVVKGKKGKKGQHVAQAPPAKPVTITQEPEMGMDAEPPPPVSSTLWGTATNVAKNVWDTASSSLPGAKTGSGMSAVEEPELAVPVAAPAPSKGTAKKTAPAPASKKGKKVTIMEEPDVDADPIVSPPPSAKTKSAWGSVNGKSKAPVVSEVSEVEPSAPLLPPPTRGKKAAEPAVRSLQKPQLKVAISEELESEVESSPAPMSFSAQTNKNKFTWDVPTVAPSTSTSLQASNKATQQQTVPRHGATGSISKSVRVDTVPVPADAWLGTSAAGGSMMPGALSSVPSEQEEDEGDASAWFKPENLSYWANFMAGSPEAERPTQMHAQAPTMTVPPPPATDPTGKHVRWTPTASGESDDEDGFGDGDTEFATSMWVQYAISGGDLPGLSGAPEEPPISLSETQRDAGTSVWEQGKARKKSTDRAALAGQWPKMESWLSPPARGQNSGSTRVF